MYGIDWVGSWWKRSSAHAAGYTAVGVLRSDSQHPCDACAWLLVLPCRYHGCCCESCQTAPRLLRPIKVDGGNYGSWGNYADVDSFGPLISTKRTRECSSCWAIAPQQSRIDLSARCRCKSGAPWSILRGNNNSSSSRAQTTLPLLHGDTKMPGMSNLPHTTFGTTPLLRPAVMCCAVLLQVRGVWRAGRVGVRL